MRYVVGNAPSGIKQLRVYLLSDLHFGSDVLDKKLWNRVKKDIRKHRESARIIILGDLIEGVTKNSKGDLYEEVLNPRQQVNMAVEEFKEFADLIEAVIIGNHDIRIKDSSSFDPMEIFCDKLGIPDKYVGFEAILSYSMNKNHYSFQLFHGSGGAVTRQAIINKMKKLRKSNCDVMAIGHHHREIDEFFYEYDIDKYNHKLRKKRKWFICANTLTGYATYAQRFGYEEKSPSQCVVNLSAKSGKWDIQPEWIR